MYKRMIALVMLCCFVMCGIASATETGGETSPDETLIEESTPEESTPEESIPEESTPEESTPEESTPEESTPEDDSVYYDADSDPVTMGYSVYEVTDPDDRSGSTIAAAVVSVFGEYQPVTHTVTDHLSDGSSVTYEQVVPGLAGVDWVWVAGVGFSALILYSVFRMLGVLVK